MNYVQSTPFSQLKAVYDPKAFFLHAASLHQTFVHCGIFSTAATRRCTNRVSVSSLEIGLSPLLPVIALVSHYLTNQLIGPRPILKRFASLPITGLYSQIALKSQFPIFNFQTFFVQKLEIRNQKFKVVNIIQSSGHGELSDLSTSYAPLQGMYQGITNSFAGCPCGPP